MIFVLFFDIECPRGLKRTIVGHCCFYESVDLVKMESMVADGSQDITEIGVEG